jgi:SOS-response transcriptional repressor LexA
MSRRARAEADILAFIAAYTREYDKPPSLQEIADALDYESSATPYWHLKHLRDAGKVTWEPRTRRSLRITQEAS